MSQFNLVLDSSQIVAFLECPQKWVFQYQKNLELKEQQHQGFNKGTIVHGMLERYYKHIHESWPTAQAIVLAKVRDERKELDIDDDTFNLLLNRFINYTSRYQDDLLPVEHNGKLVIESGFSYPVINNDRFLFILEGRIDIIAKFDSFVAIVDHKTQARYRRFYPFSIQFMNYALAMGLNRVMINVIGLQEKFDEKNLFRQPFYYSTEKLAQWKKKLELIFYRVANALILNSYEKNEASCPGKYGYPCDYCKICEETKPEIIDNIIKFKYKERPIWTPWSEDE